MPACLQHQRRHRGGRPHTCADDAGLRPVEATSTPRSANSRDPFSSALLVPAEEPGLIAPNPRRILERWRAQWYARPEAASVCHSPRGNMRQLLVISSILLSALSLHAERISGRLQQIVNGKGYAFELKAPGIVSVLDNDTSSRSRV